MTKGFDGFKLAKWLLLLPMLGICLVSSDTLFPFIVGKYVWVRTTVGLAALAFIWGLLFQDVAGLMWARLKEVMRQPLVIAVTIFVAIFLLACFFGVDPAMSFWSNFERGEGGLQMLNLWVFFILLVTLFRDEKGWQRLFIFALTGGFLMAAYGFMAGFGVQGYLGPRFFADRFQGSIGNPAYVAAYTLFMLFYAAYLLVSKYRARLLSAGAFVLYALSAMFVVAFWLAATRGAFLGFVASLIGFLGYFVYAKKVWRTRLLVAIIVVIVAVGILVKFKDTPLVRSLPGSRIFDISIGAQTFEDRTYMWHIAIDGFKERPLLGWGPESFLRVFDRHFDIGYFKPAQGFGAWFDRAHSVYFDYLVETGALGLASYLAVFAVFYWQFFRRLAQPSFLASRTHFERGFLFSILFAYLVQGIVLFDVTPISMNVFLILAFGAYQFTESRGHAMKSPH